MKPAYISTLAIAIVVGCSSQDNVRDYTPQADSALQENDGINDVCDGVTTPEPCSRLDGLPGHCAYNMCVISCDAAAECPASTCRTSHCIKGTCEYVGVFDGTDCTIDNIVGSCESYVCVAPN